MIRPAAALEDRRKRRRQDRRELILRVARGVFLAKGYPATTMDEIAEAAGLSVGAVYLYFRNKPVLYLSLLELALQKQERAIRRAVQGGSGSSDKILRLAEAYADYFLREPEYFQALVFLQHGDLRIPESEQLAQALADRGAALLRFVAGLIEAGVESGELKRVDPFDTALFLWGAWNGVIGLTLRRDPLRLDRRQLKGLLRMGTKIIDDGLRAIRRH